MTRLAGKVAIARCFAGEGARVVRSVANDVCFMTGENIQVSGGPTMRRNSSKRDVLNAMTVEDAI